MRCGKWQPGEFCCSTNMDILLQSESLSSSSEFPEFLWIPTSSSAVPGGRSRADFENVNGTDTCMPFFQLLDKEENGAEDFDRSFNLPGKKRRLTASQIQFLEKNFAVESKLEPERKVQLAKELGLQPRQVAIWFQNRRARFKNKQLGKDYDSLKACYDKLKADHDSLLKEVEDLKTEVVSLKEKLFVSDNAKENLEALGTMNSSNAEPHKTIVNRSTTATPENISKLPLLPYKQEAASSAKSDVVDSDSPYHTGGNHSSLIEPADSSFIFEPDQSDFSQEEEDNLGKSLLHPPYLPTLEEERYNLYAQANPCSFEFLVEDQSWSSLY